MQAKYLKILRMNLMIKKKANYKLLDKKELTLVEHLGELRKRIVYSVIIFIFGVLISYNYSEIIIKDIVNISPDTNFVFIAPTELLMSYIKISLVGGLVLAAPLLLFQLWQFVSPGLNIREKKYIIVSLFSGSIFFIIGLIFSYIMVLPTMIMFFIGFQIEEIQPMISFSSYLSFVINTLLAFGLIFELPIVMLLLSRFGLVNVSFIKKNRKYFVLVIFIVAAIVTPPDVVSQVLLAIPMMILFEIGIFISTLAEKKRDNKNPS